MLQPTVRTACGFPSSCRAELLKDAPETGPTGPPRELGKQRLKFAQAPPKHAYSTTTMLLERQRSRFIQEVAHLQTPAQTQREKAEPAGQTPLLRQAT